MKTILSYDESGYKGEYEYRLDPDHTNPPKDGGWYLTGHGWARGSNRSRGHEPSRVIKNEQKTIPSAQHCAKILKSSKDANTFVASGMQFCAAASREVLAQNGDHRSNCQSFDDLIYGFADKNKPSVAPTLSTLMGYIFGLSPDFRNEGKPFHKYDKDEVEQAKKYIAGEQEIIHMTGLVDEDDTITLFRNTDENQVLTKHSGAETTYKGNNIESWTTNHGLKYYDEKGKEAKRKTKIMAKVPLSACIASCIGREKRPFMFKHTGECEIMVCGAFIKNIVIVGNAKDGIKDDSIRNDYLHKAQSNMQRFANQHKAKKASTRNARINRIAKRIAAKFN